MKIGLIDVDGRNFPNLPLMKISAWHKSKNDTVEFADMLGQYDIIYKSKVFTWTPDNEYAYNYDKYITGGTGAYGVDKYIDLEDEIEHMCPDYSLYNCEHAYGFIVRGCIRKCSWCIVPEKEGGIKANADIEEFISDKKSAILLDNNVLASEHGINQIEKIIKKGIKIDFNQGMDARLVDNSIAKLLSKVNWIRNIRFSCDKQSHKKYIKKAVGLLKKYGIKPYRIFVYVLIQDTSESEERAIFLRDLGVDVFGQPFRDKENTPPGYEQMELSRWINVRQKFKTVSFEKFKSERQRV